MKLLIVTQAVDLDDPVLGFFHRWIEESANKTEQVTVIAQRVGHHALPQNVTVLDLGKNAGVARPVQVVSFWRYCIAYRKHYDAVLVHMTPIWLVLGGPLWFLLRKHRYLWYEARGGGLPLKMALPLARRVFSASEDGFPLATPKHMVMGHGIEAAPITDAERDPTLLVSIGRITAAKRVDLVLKAFAACPATTRLRLVGAPMTPEDHDEMNRLLAVARELKVNDRIELGPLPRDEALPLLRRASMFLHASVTGLDKAPLEAMAAGCPTVSCADALQPFLPNACKSTPATFPVVAARIFGLSEAERRHIGLEQRATVEREHALPSLIERLMAAMDR